MKIIFTHNKSVFIIFLTWLLGHGNLQANIIEDYHLNKAEKEIRHAFKKTEVPLYEGIDDQNLHHEPPPEKIEKLNISQTLGLAILQNPTIQKKRDTLNSQALKFNGIRHSYTPQLAASLSYLISGTEDTQKKTNQSQNFTLTQKSGLGGQFKLALKGNQNNDVTADFNSSATISLSQPLLKGFGRDLSREDYVMGKRALIYDMRAFKRFLDDFCIDIIQDFTSLVNLQTKAQNLEKRFRKDEWLYKRTNAFFNVGRVSKLELLRV
ncbi:MAG: TolC family protein, partial [Planctomycetes bacterium]|nr:TolC family protein [Planctomycetota bacterium]